MSYMRWMVLPVLMCLVAVQTVRADDYTAALIDEPAPADKISEEIAGQLSGQVLKVMEGDSRTVCEIWLVKEIAGKPGFEATPDVLYPFQPGHLIGVLRWKRRSGDFRDQEIGSGVYTLRYALQPVDGNHVGTSPTRDFLMLAPAEDDTSPAPMEMDKLIELSFEASESSHPAMLCLQAAGEGKRPGVRYNEDKEWRMLQFNAKVKTGDKVAEVPVDLIIEGHTSE